MIITTTDKIPGKEVKEILGVVRGNTIRAKWLGKDIVSGLRQLVGGELREYTEMMTEAREEAVKRMKHQARQQKADAIINVRMTTSQVMANAAEILAYGTAVKLKTAKKGGKR